MMKSLLRALFFLALLWPFSLAHAQSTAQPTIPGYLTTTGCPAGYTTCFVPYGSSSPGMPVTITNSAGVIATFQTTPTACTAGQPCGPYTDQYGNTYTALPTSSTATPITSGNAVLATGGTAQTAFPANSSRLAVKLYNDCTQNTSGDTIYIALGSNSPTVPIAGTANNNYGYMLPCGGLSPPLPVNYLGAIKWIAASTNDVISGVEFTR